ncbi:MAG: MmgE/PrpD family protein [Dehalococcoidia bacterium]|nr:MmgE/PrpD family protein [Dehalococcoidia bacterium]
MSVAEIVARFVAETGFDEVPAQAIEFAKGAIRDCIGVTLAAVGEPSSAAMLELVQELGGNPSSRILGSGIKSSPRLAALANGTMSHALDYDDMTWTMQGHPSVPVLPAALALGEYVGASGRDVVLAYLLGYEVETKLALAIGENYFSQGWHPTAVLGTMGAAAASARILGLSPTESCMALGIGASQASGLREAFGTDTKPFHAGHAARSGVMATMLARKGLTASIASIDGPQGFLNSFGGGGQATLGPLMEGLGRPYDILRLRPAIKCYPCCYGTHRGLDAILYIISNQEIDPNAVDAVVCSVPERVQRSLIHSNPVTGLEAKFSLGYTVAAAIVDKGVVLRSFTDDQVMRPQVRSLMARVRRELRHGESPDDDPTIVTVKLKDGREFSHSVAFPRGNPAIPLTEAELEVKYCDCAREALSEEDVQRSSEMLSRLEELTAIRMLTSILGKRR